MSEKCEVCLRGSEACQYCEGLSEGDWKAICDCGLYDFGKHIVTCEERFKFRYVVASDHEAAMQPR